MLCTWIPLKNYRYLFPVLKIINIGVHTTHTHPTTTSPPPHTHTIHKYWAIFSSLSVPKFVFLSLFFICNVSFYFYYYFFTLQYSIGFAMHQHESTMGVHVLPKFISHWTNYFQFLYQNCIFFILFILWLRYFSWFCIIDMPSWEDICP